MSDGTSVSVLLPVHQGVEPEVFRQALDSVLDQTRPADEIVVVEDGPIPESVEAVLSAAALRHPELLRIRLETNQGAGVANQAGLVAASGEWIAKMDADDISKRDRFERQLVELHRSGADVCGTSMLEFDGEARNLIARREVPLDHGSIARRMRSNNPFNHPTVMYRRTLALSSGGYPEMRLMQDYVLFARMLGAGARMMNMSEPLVLFRAGDSLHGRRSGRGFSSLERQVQRELRAVGVVSRGRAAVNYLIRLGYRYLPVPALRWVHGHILSRPLATKERAT
jgi:glycosyltransferase involved in cell wall biosynthesis